MRSDSEHGRPALALTLLASAAAGCGNYSNDDLAFLAALPSREQLHIAVPAADGAPLCLLGEASAALNARTSGGNVNQLVDGVLALVDRIRAVPPSERDGDRRTWGPWPEDRHPGVAVRVSMARARGRTPADDRFDYLFEQQRAPGPWVALIAGAFVGARAATGTGQLVLDFDAAWTVGTSDSSTPHGQFRVAYTLAGDPRTVEASVSSLASASLEPDVAYRFAGYVDGRALFDFAFHDASRNQFTVTARFAASGNGRSEVSVRTPSGASASITECFDGLACIRWLDDPLGLTPACDGRRPCFLGARSACPAGLPGLP